MTQAPVKCPDWSGDEAEHASKRCAELISKTLTEAHATALRKVPDCGDIANWHSVVFRDVAPLRYYAGGLRQNDPNRPCLAVNVGVPDSAGQVIPGSHYDSVLRHADELSLFIQTHIKILELRWHDLPGLERTRRVALVVGRAVGAFIKIHPFRNGNGRMSRMLWSVLLHRLGYQYRLSVLEHPSVPAYDQIMEASMKGDHAPAVAFVLAALGQPMSASSKLPVP